MKFDACSTHHPFAANLVIVSAPNKNRVGCGSAQTSVFELSQKRSEEALRIKANNPDLSVALANVKLNLGITEGRGLLENGRLYCDGKKERRKRELTFMTVAVIFRTIRQVSTFGMSFIKKQIKDFAEIQRRTKLYEFRRVFGSFGR